MKRFALLAGGAFTALLVLSACSDSPAIVDPAESGPTQAALDGSLEITIRTTGSSDKYSYELIVDFDRFETVGQNQVVDFGGLVEGQHMVMLSGVADTCALSGPNPRSITITAGETDREELSVSCGR